MLEELRHTTKATEEIRSQISGSLWVQQKRWEFKRDVYVRLLEALGEIQYRTEVFRGLCVRPGDPPLNEQEQQLARDMYDRMAACVADIRRSIWLAGAVLPVPSLKALNKLLGAWRPRDEDIDAPTFFDPLLNETKLVLNPGDILVTDSEVGSVIRVDPVTGAQTVVSSGNFLISPAGLAIGLSGELYVAQNAAVLGQLRALVRIDPATGGQTLISSGGILESMRAVALDSAGRILIAQGNSAVNGIIHVDVDTGAQSIISSGGLFVDPVGLAVESTGQLLVVDQEAVALPASSSASR